MAPDITVLDEAIRQQAVAEYFRICCEVGFDSSKAAQFRRQYAEDAQFSELARSIDDMMMHRERAINPSPDPEL